MTARLAQLLRPGGRTGRAVPPRLRHADSAGSGTRGLGAGLGTAGTGKLQPQGGHPTAMGRPTETQPPRRPRVVRRGTTRFLGAELIDSRMRLSHDASGHVMTPARQHTSTGTKLKGSRQQFRMDVWNQVKPPTYYRYYRRTLRISSAWSKRRIGLPAPATGVHGGSSGSSMGDAPER